LRLSRRVVGRQDVGVRIDAVRCRHGSYLMFGRVERCRVVGSHHAGIVFQRLNRRQRLP
jgi:hypothetical protein